MDNLEQSLRNLTLGSVHRQGHGADRRSAPERQQHVPPSAEHDGDPARLQDRGSGAAESVR
jgi:hypothetical protein